MRVLVLGGTRFIGRRIVERLHARNDQVLVVHRGNSEPAGWVPVQHLHTERHTLGAHAKQVRAFDPDAVIDTYALTAGDVDAVLPFLPEVPTVVLSSQDVYQAAAGLRTGQVEASVPLTEDAELRRQRYPYRGAGLPGVPDDYDKLDVEQRWLPRGAVVLRLPLVYGPYDEQVREDLVLRRVRADRRQMPVGAGNMLWSRAHVDDVACAVLAAIDTRAADGHPLNIGERTTPPCEPGSNRSSQPPAPTCSSSGYPTSICRPTSRSLAHPPNTCSPLPSGRSTYWAGTRPTPPTGSSRLCAGTFSTRHQKDGQITTAKPRPLPSPATCSSRPAEAANRSGRKLVP